MKKRIPLFVTAVLAASFLASCSFSLAEDITPPPNYQAPNIATEAQGPFFPASAPDPARGADLYTENCVRCHGPTGMGDGEVASQLQNPPAPLGDPSLARAASASEWYEIVTTGRMDRFMPPFNSLTDQERWDVVAYSLSLSISQENNDTAASLFEQECAACHGPKGAGTSSLAALADPQNTASRSSQDFFSVITDGLGDMPGYEDSLMEEQRWALADYSRSLMFTGEGSVETASATSEPAPIVEITAVPEITATEAVTLTAWITPTGSLGGKLNNFSGDPLPSDQVVTIHAFDSMAIAGTFTTTAQADGSFSAGVVEMPVNRIFLASTEYQGVTYTSDIATVSEGTTDVDLQIPVYGTSTDTSTLSVDRMHLFFDFTTEGIVQVVELYLVSNPTDRTIVAEGDGLPVLTFHLPEGATNLQFQDSAIGQRYIELPGGFGDTMQIAPGLGQHQVLFAYDIPFTNRLTLRIPQTLPIQAVTVLLPEDGVKVKSEQLADGGTRDVQGTAYHMYNGGALNPGDTLEVSLVRSGINTNLVIGLAALGGVLLVVGAVMFLYNRNQAEVETVPAYEENEDNLMDAIIALDDSYKTGDLSEEAYRARRAELKDKLKRLQDDRG